MPTLVAIAVLTLGTGDVRAGEQPLNQCIKLGPEIGATNLLAPYAPTVREVTRQVLTGDVGYILGFVDYPDDHGNSVLDPNPKQILVYPTTHGVHVLRVFHLGYGPF